ncbi:hypothetical protein J1614_008168 [Plenodomus biglobosus]|nr:hypothetical protein J1614_008168 [Plenodomus biglobosus]
MQSEEFEASEFGPEIPSDSFRWVHVPVNDVEILKTCVAKIAPDGADSLHKACVEKIRPTSAIPPNIIPDHAWSMEASFEAHVIESAGTQHPFTLFRAKSSQTTITPRLKHPRKTLDQFFYTGLNNTETRDAGQTISKWTSKSSKMTAKGMETAEDDSHIIMVDQLWICAVNHSKFDLA